MKIEGKLQDREFRPIWKQVKNVFKKLVRKKKLELYREKKCQQRGKEMKSETQNQKCNIWLEQNLTPRKTSTIMSMIEQTLETRAWKEVRRLTENCQFRLCERNNERQCNIFFGWKQIVSKQLISGKTQQNAHDDGYCMGKRTKCIKSECETILIKGN